MKYIVIKYCGDVYGRDENVCYQCPECNKLFWGKPDTCTCGVGFVWSKDDDGMGDGIEVKIDQYVPHQYIKQVFVESGQDASDVYEKFLCPNCSVGVTREQDHCDICKAKIIWE